MYKALYAFKKTHPTSLSFAENDVFIELPGASGDKNWYYVLTLNGISGFVPKNYVQRETLAYDDFINKVDSAREKVKNGQMPDREKGDLLAKLDLARKNFVDENKPPPTATQQNAQKGLPQPPQQQQPNQQKVIPQQHSQPLQAITEQSSSQTPSQLQSQTQQKSPQLSNHNHNHVQQQQKIQVQESNSLSTSPRSSTPPKSSKKRAAPPPPAGVSGSASNSPRSSESPDRISLADPPVSKPNLHRQRSSSSGRRPSIGDPSPEQLRQSGRDLVELVRDHTGLSHVTSQSTAMLVLNFLTENFQRLDRNIPALLEEMEHPTAPEKDHIIVSADAKALEALFEDLTKRKEDDQQRNWMLHKDEHIIRDLLKNLQNVLQNAQKEVCLYVLKKYKYFYVLSLVEYFQMETRWTLRQKLIETFMLMCSLDPVIISIMLTSVLPTELAQDLFQHTDNVDRMRHCGLLLTVVFSRGEQMPVHYFNQLGESFVHYLLEHIENPLSREHERDVVDVFIGLMLSYNLQFKDKSSNVTVKCLKNRSSAKAFTEQLLLLLNREEDPTAIVTPHFDEDFFHSAFDDSSQTPPNATHKMVLDIFQDNYCHELFYTNDLYVLIDIIVRQLSDLSSEDVKRKWYANMCQLVLLRSNYSEHLHRFKDLERCFMRILEEEEQSPEKEIVAKICREIPAFASLNDTDSVDF